MPAHLGALRRNILRPNIHFAKRRLFAVSTWCQTNEKQQPLSFQGQLYENTQQRLKREPHEQESFAPRNTSFPGSLYAALAFGTSYSQ